MIAFEVRVNGKRVCVAGAADLAVLTAAVTAVGKLGPKTVPFRPDDAHRDVSLHVGGLTRRPDPKKDVHLNWRSSSPLQVGDVVQVKVLDVKQADRPRSRTKARRRRA